MYCNPTTVRELTPLLTSEAVTDAIIQSFIFRAEAVINNAIGRRYQVPIRKITNLSGTISTTAASATISGTDTDFTNEVFVGDYLYSPTTRESLRVLSVTDGTTITASSDAISTNSNVSYFVMPAEIVTASEYLTAKLILDHHLGKRAYSQDHEIFTNQYKDIAKDLIAEIKKGDYYNTELSPQASAKNRSRLGYINNTNDFRKQVDNSAAYFSSSDFSI